MKLVGLLLVFCGLGTTATGFATVAHDRENWLNDGLGIVGLVMIGVGIFALVWRTQTTEPRGFEVKLNPGTTPGLIEKMEE